MIPRISYGPKAACVVPSGGEGAMLAAGDFSPSFWVKPAEAPRTKSGFAQAPQEIWTSAPVADVTTSWLAPQ